MLHAPEHTRPTWNIKSTRVVGEDEGMSTLASSLTAVTFLN